MEKQYFILVLCGITIFLKSAGQAMRGEKTAFSMSNVFGQEGNNKRSVGLKSVKVVV